MTEENTAAETFGDCGYDDGDWRCREGGYLWYAGDGEGFDPSDCSYLCPHCRTQDYLEAAKEDAESCSEFSNNGVSGTGLDLWRAAEAKTLVANRPEALKALASLGPVSALEGDTSPQGYRVVLCNTQQISQ